MRCRNLRILSVAVVSSFSLVGCQAPYLASQAAGQARLLASAESTASLRAAGRCSPTLLATFDEVDALLSFAARQGFSVGDAYRTYAVPAEGFPVWIVSACPPDRLEPVAWSFPLVGSFPYKGYFRRVLAEREADLWRAKGYEVDLRPALAYSTLGYFADPLVPTLLLGDAGQRAGGILHELAHRTVFVPGEPRLNESISVSIENFAVRAWLMELGDTEALEEHTRRLADRERLRSEVASLLDELREVFTAESRQERIAGKEAALARFAALWRQEPPQSAHYGGLVDAEWSLPALLLIDVYGGDGELLERVFDRCENSLPTYLQRLQEAAETEDPRGTLEKWAESGKLLSWPGTIGGGRA